MCILKNNETILFGNNYIKKIPENIINNKIWEDTQIATRVSKNPDEVLKEINLQQAKAARDAARAAAAARKALEAANRAAAKAAAEKAAATRKL